MINTPVTIQGETFTDQRGWLRAFNDLDLTGIKRMYQICPANTQTIRAWQYHKNETKIFQVIKGAFVIKVLKIQDPYSGVADSGHSFKMDANSGKVLIVPGGYANGFKAITHDSILQVFSNFTVEESQKDDIRIPETTFNINWKV